jgi:hypothetical protein
MTTMKRIRCNAALKRLQDQLKSGVKTEKKSFNKIPLTEFDRKRIEKEIQVLISKNL